MSARGRLLSGLVTIVIALAGFVGLGALPAAASPSVIQYVALGDSYAAGQGGGDYLNGCLQTAESYPELLDLESRIHLQANPTCTGARASEMAAQLEALNDDTRLVTLTVGAADLGLSALLAVCSDPTRTLDCLAAIQNVREVLLPALGSNLTVLYAEVARAAPKARVVVTGYPHLLEPTAPFDPVLIAAINGATDALNSTIEQAVSFTNEADVNIHYADVTAAFAGHGIGSTDPFIHGLLTDNGLPDPDAFHPNAAGYRAYADVISAALPGGWLDKQKQSA
jgi:lysophospholipase L1-like esterase